MRVALVSPYDLDVPGGVQSHVLALADHLAEDGDDVVIVGPGRRSRGRIRAVGRSFGLPFNDSVAPLALSPLVHRRVARVLADFEPDVVHVHEPAVPMVSTSAVLASTAPVVATFHAWSERHAAYRGARPLLRPVLDRIDRRIAVSAAAASYHAAALGVSEAGFEVIPNGVDVDRFQRARPFAQMQEQPSLLFVGRLEPRKGLTVLIRAYVRLKTQIPALRLYVVGDGPEREEAQSLVSGPLRADVVFLGRVSDDELPRFFRSCDVFVSPALSGESFGIVLIEAMAAGRAVVASDIPGYRSVVRDGVNGRLVPPGDPVALAEALAALLTNDHLADALADEASSGLAVYDWSNVATRVREVYEDAIGAA